MEREQLEEFVDAISYSARCESYIRSKVSSLTNCRYNDDEYEYRHVQLPKQMLKHIPKEYFDATRQTLKLLWEDEWRGLGITQVSDATLDSGKYRG